MEKEILEEVILIEDQNGHVVEEDIAIAEIVSKKEHPKDELEISVELLDDPQHIRHRLRVHLDAPLSHILEGGARKFDQHLLPSSDEPLDHLRAVYAHHETGDSLDLMLSLREFLQSLPVTHHFAIDLVLAIRINTRWRIAPICEMTPKAILNLADLSPEEYSLYKPSETLPLPPDTPVKLRRGECFEAQRDGKYGEYSYANH